MIYIATVHFQTEKWIDIQNQYFNYFIKEDFRVFAFLNDLPNSHSQKFYYSSTEDIKSHSIKLNLLGDLILLDSENDEDWIIFIDGDAFPINDIVEYGKLHFMKYPLLAVRRDEDDGEKQPHPCFCMTTVKFWKDIKGDWNAGHTWKNNRGNDITDVGGNLLGILQKRKANWYPMLRTNKQNLHPLLFGVYGNVVYHHTAGFRTPKNRLEIQSANRVHLIFQALVENIIPQSVRHIIPQNIRAIFRADRKIIKANKKPSQKIYESILEDFYFYEYFLAEHSNKKLNNNIKLPSSCVILLTMHRSGSSCLSGILQEQGLYLGIVNEYNAFNKKGTRENIEISKLNDDVLQHNNGSWSNPPDKILWNNQLSRKRDKIIRKMSIKACGRPWGFKDPRTVITLPFWMEGLDNVKIIALYRNPLSVVNSLAKRGEISISRKDGFELWKDYNLKILSYMAEMSFPLVSFDADREEYENVIEGIINKMGGMEFKPENVSFYDKSLIHNNNGLNEKNTLPKDVLKIYNRLNTIYEQQSINDKVL